MMATIKPEEIEERSMAMSPSPDDSPPTSRKRSLTDGNNEAIPVPPAKRQRIVESGLRSPPPEEYEDAITAVMDTRPAFDNEVFHLLQRSIALVLEHVGFDGASKEALEAMCGEVDSYAAKFMSYVTEAMTSARRTLSIPLDFEYALRREGLTASLLTPHLKPPVPTLKTQLHFDLPVPEELPYTPPAELIGEELSGAPEKDTKKYIPKKFPSFPSLHTFKSTEVKAEREVDPRKIREKATEAARHGEEALRRLVKVGKVGEHKGAKKTLDKNPKHKIRHELWERTMEDLASGKMTSASLNKDGGDEEQSILIDAGRQYGRRPVTRVKQPSVDHVTSMG